MDKRAQRLRKLEDAYERAQKKVQSPRLIKMFNPASAEALIRKGYPYIIERVGSGLNMMEVYAFFESPELLDYVTSNYTSQDYYFDTRVSF